MIIIPSYKFTQLVNRAIDKLSIGLPKEYKLAYAYETALVDSVPFNPTVDNKGQDNSIFKPFFMSNSGRGNGPNLGEILQSIGTGITATGASMAEIYNRQAGINSPEEHSEPFEEYDPISDLNVEDEGNSNARKPPISTNTSSTSKVKRTPNSLKLPEIKIYEDEHDITNPETYSSILQLQSIAEKVESEFSKTNYQEALVLLRQSPNSELAIVKAIAEAENLVDDILMGFSNDTKTHRNLVQFKDGLLTTRSIIQKRLDSARKILLAESEIHRGLDTSYSHTILTLYNLLGYCTAIMSPSSGAKEELELRNANLISGSENTRIIVTLKRALENLTNSRAIAEQQLKKLKYAVPGQFSYYDEIIDRLKIEVVTSLQKLNPTGNLPDDLIGYRQLRAEETSTLEYERVGFENRAQKIKNVADGEIRALVDRDGQVDYRELMSSWKDTYENLQSQVQDWMGRLGDNLGGPRSAITGFEDRGLQQTISHYAKPLSYTLASIHPDVLTRSAQTHAARKRSKLGRWLNELSLRHSIKQTAQAHFEEYREIAIARSDRASLAMINEFAGPINLPQRTPQAEPQAHEPISLQRQFEELPVAMHDSTQTPSQQRQLGMSHPQEDSVRFTLDDPY
jgi:hypothetical protein